MNLLDYIRESQDARQHEKRRDLVAARIVDHLNDTAYNYQEEFHEPLYSVEWGYLMKYDFALSLIALLQGEVNNE